jgi:hypothetical protein
VLDFRQPVALMLLHILHFIPDTDDPYGIVAKLMEPLPSGSYLVIAHATVEITPGAREAAQRYSENNTATMSARSRSEVARFFDGLDLVEPGVTPVGVWRPGPMEDIPTQGLASYTAVGRKP